MAWNPLTQPVSKFILDDYPSAGTCQQPEGAAVKYKLDERTAYGVDYAFVVYTGRENARFKTELLLRTVEDFDYWGDVFQPLIHTPPKRGPVRLSDGGYEPGKSHLIWHPQLYPLGITQCVVETEPQLVIDRAMVGHVVLEFRQVVLAPKPAYARPEAAKQDPELNAIQKDNQRLTGELAALRRANDLAGR